MAQYVLINPVGTRHAGEVLDSVQDGQEVINQLAAFGGVLVPLPNALLQPYIDRCQSLILVGNYDEATAMMQAAYASSTAISGGGTTGTIPIWSSASGIADSAISEVAGSIQTLAITNAGAGATNGSYSRQVLTGGTGTGATADIIVSGGAVIGLFLRNPGTGYTAGNTLSCATIGGAGFVFTVSSVSVSDNASGNLSGVRIGAGTNTPQSAMYARGMIYSARPEIFENGLTPAFPLVMAANVVASTIEESGGVYTLPSSIAAYYPIQSVPRISLANATATQSVIGVYSLPIVESASIVGTTTVAGGRMWARIDSPSVVGAYSMTGCNNASIINTSAAGSTVSTFTGTFSQASVSSTNALAITDTTIYASSAVFGGAAHNIATFYWLRLRAATLNNGSTITNYWGISQEDSLARTRHYGNLGVGNALDVGAGKVIGSLTLTNAGTGYTNGTYSQVALTTVTGTGTGATADIIVAGNIVTSVVLRNPGQGYAVSNTLSCASIGAGSNFLLTVATTASILRSDGTVVGTRVGAGIATPTAPLDVVGLATIRKAGLNNYVSSTSGTAFPCLTYLNIDTSGESGGVLQLQASDPSAGTVFGTNSRLQIDSSLYNGTVLISGITTVASLKNANAAGAKNVRGAQFLGNVSGTTTGVTVAVVYGLDAQASVNSSGGNTFTLMAGGFFTANVLSTAAETVTERTGVYISGGTFSGAAHVINNYYALRAVAPSLSGGSTITNRWGISQEDTAANNLIAGPIRVGASAGTVPASNTIDVSTAGWGLKLPATPGNTEPNTLDCYADGGTANSGGVTWTPVLRFGGATTGITGSQVGRYTRIGNMVFAQGTIALSSKGSATGAATIAGLPTSANVAATIYYSIAIGYNSKVTFTGQLHGLISVNSGIVELYQTSTAGVVSAITNTDFAADSVLTFTVCYPVT